MMEPLTAITAIGAATVAGGVVAGVVRDVRRWRRTQQHRPRLDELSARSVLYGDRDRIDLVAHRDGRRHAR